MSHPVSQFILNKIEEDGQLFLVVHHSFYPPTTKVARVGGNLVSSQRRWEEEGGRTRECSGGRWMDIWRRPISGHGHRVPDQSDP